jgi:hypothetical protein
VQGPHYLGVLRYTDVPEVARSFGARLRVYGEAPPEFPGRCGSLPECLR